MQKFSIPLPSFKFEKLDQDKLLKSEHLFDAFPLHSVNLLIPATELHKQPLEEILASEEGVYFIVKDVSATNLIEKSFLDHFVRSGTLVATSHNARIEVENFLSITPSGKLILSLKREISRCLALAKENNDKKKKRKKSFETIMIDISHYSFSPGRKMYDFVAFELSKIDHIKFSLLIKWTPHGNICPQSIQTYFASKSIECIACKPNLQYSSKFSVIAPKLNADECDPSLLEDLLEWIGAEICGINYSNEENEYVSKFFPPPSSVTLKKLYKCNYEGLYSKVEVIPLLKKIRELLQADDSIPFIVALLNGYQDSYISSPAFQKFSSADKILCIVAFPSLKNWVLTLNAR